MKILILWPNAAYGAVGGFRPTRGGAFETLFSKSARENMYPEFPLRGGHSLYAIAHAFNTALMQSDLVIAVGTESTFAFGSLVERALNTKLLVCALVPTHLRQSAIDYEFNTILEMGSRPLTRDYYYWTGDGIESTVKEIERILTSHEEHEPPVRDAA